MALISFWIDKYTYILRFSTTRCHTAVIQQRYSVQHCGLASQYASEELRWIPEVIPAAIIAHKGMVAIRTASRDTPHAGEGSPQFTATVAFANFFAHMLIYTSIFWLDGWIPRHFNACAPFGNSRSFSQLDTQARTQSCISHTSHRHVFLLWQLQRHTDTHSRLATATATHPITVINTQKNKKHLAHKVPCRHQSSKDKSMMIIMIKLTYEKLPWKNDTLQGSILLNHSGEHRDSNINANTFKCLSLFTLRLCTTHHLAPQVSAPWVTTRVPAALVSMIAFTKGLAQLLDARCAPLEGGKAHPEELGATLAPTRRSNSQHFGSSHRRQGLGSAYSGSATSHLVWGGNCERLGALFF